MPVLRDDWTRLSSGHRKEEGGSLRPECDVLKLKSCDHCPVGWVPSCHNYNVCY